MKQFKTKTAWYREPWPWILMAGPFVVVVAGFVTLWLAMSSDDGLVSKDYYKEGLAVAETLARDQRAEALGVQASLRLTAEQLQVRLQASAAEFIEPASLQVQLSHPTRAGLDQIIQLQRQGDGYQGAMRLPRSGQWLVLIEDEASSWRLIGSVVLPAAGEFRIGKVDRLPAPATQSAEKAD